MAIQYLLVTFHEQRSVLADGVAVGFTNHTLLLPGDEYQISLDGSGYSPASQDVVLGGTSIVQPMVVAFEPSAVTVAVTRGVPASPAKDAVVLAPAKPVVTQKAAAKKVAASPAPAPQATAKSAPSKSVLSKSVSSKSAPIKSAPAKSPAAKSPAAVKAPAKKAAATTTAPRKAVAKKAAAKTAGKAVKNA